MYEHSIASRMPECCQGTQNLELAPQARFELATLRLTAEVFENLCALSGVAYKKSGAILALLGAPNPALKICFSAPSQLVVVS